MTDNIKPEHYRTGEIDLYEAWYRTYPFEQYRAIMQAVAERYMRRDKNDRVEDLGKAIYTLERLREKEIEHDKQNSKTIREAFDDMREAFGGVKTKIAGECLEEIYFSRQDLLKRLLEAGYRYLARDRNNALFAYEGAPSKEVGLGLWGTHIDFNNEHIGNDDLQEVKWSDAEPTQISDLLATYQNGGEDGK